MSRLVISVRSVEEVEPALNGGADLLDVKAPARGSLGRADFEVVREVVRAVGGRIPVSAAMGEWRERNRDAEDEILTLGLRFVKWGFTGYPERVPHEIIERKASLPGGTEMVLVSYGDWKRADAPSPGQVWSAAREHGFSTILFDTFVKDGTSLLNHLPVGELDEFVKLVQSRQIDVVLAGSLTAKSIAELKLLRPAWFAVRGAACGEGDREGTIDETRVRGLKRILED